MNEGRGKPNRESSAATIWGPSLTIGLLGHIFKYQRSTGTNNTSTRPILATCGAAVPFHRRFIQETPGR